jgi:hypothetical protein
MLTEKQGKQKNESEYALELSKEILKLRKDNETLRARMEAAGKCKLSNVKYYVKYINYKL